MRLANFPEAVEAIRSMVVRGAPVGVAAAYRLQVAQYA
jgi:methylthioribose-1-phosphate isomerase